MEECMKKVLERITVEIKSLLAELKDPHKRQEWISNGKIFLQKAMKSLALSVRFLTIIPLKSAPLDDEAVRNSMISFPVAGLLIGLFALLVNLMVSWAYPVMISSVLVILFYALITGGLHLDGLADTFDGIASARPREKILEIMKDSRIGTMGVLSLIFVIVLKILFLSNVPASTRTLTILLLPVLSRWSMLIPIYYVRYARSEGLGGSFSKAINKRAFIISTLITLFISVFLLRFSGIILMAVTALSTALISFLINKKIDGFTGDTLGATCELNEVVILALMGMGAAA
jgi:adenosylcobinamide-GDP ribazoletransferase